MRGSYLEARKIVEPFLMPLERYDVCVNDCVIYRKERIGFDKCDVCGEERYDASKNARRTFTYFPLGPRLARMLEASKDIPLLLNDEKEFSNIVKDVQDAANWNIKWFHVDGLFKGRIGKRRHWF